MKTNTTISYWHNNATHSKWMEENYPLLVKDSGPSDTIEGEMIRAVSRLNYDWGNNGMCNNTSGACNYLREIMDFTDEEDESWDIVYAESNTGGYTSHPNLIEHITKVSDAVIEYVISKNGNYETLTENCDMFNFQDPDYEYDEGYYDEQGHYAEY
jgi:hypothetical protein